MLKEIDDVIKERSNACMGSNEDAAAWVRSDAWLKLFKMETLERFFALSVEAGRIKKAELQDLRYKMIEEKFALMSKL